MQNKKYIPNYGRAVCSGTIVTIKNGKRHKREYYSGEPLDGFLYEDENCLIGNKKRGVKNDDKN